MDKIMTYALFGLAALGGYYIYQKYELKDKIFKRAAKYAE